MSKDHLNDKDPIIVVIGPNGDTGIVFPEDVPLPLIQEARDRHVVALFARNSDYATNGVFEIEGGVGAVALDPAVVRADEVLGDQYSDVIDKAMQAWVHIRLQGLASIKSEVGELMVELDMRVSRA